MLSRTPIVEVHLEKFDDRFIQIFKTAIYHTNTLYTHSTIILFPSFLPSVFQDNC